MKKKNEKIINNKIRDLLLNQKGMALLTTLIFVFILVTFAVSLLIMTSNDTKLSALQRDSTEAFYIAEAGIERTLYNLKEDYKSTKNWNDDDIINEYELSDKINGFQRIGYVSASEYDVTFGEGTYTVFLKINSANDVTIKSKGKHNNESTRYVQIDAKMEGLSIWDNAIFAGDGASGGVINGNVDIRGGVHILGDGLNPGDTAIDISGTGGIGNNYDGMDSDLRSRIKDPPTIEDEGGNDIETLNAKLKVKQGNVNLSGTGTAGDIDISGNLLKETLDGVYINGDFGGNQGENNVHSDEIEPYDDFVAGTYDFPNLGTEYISPETEDVHIDYDAYLVAEAYEINNPLSTNRTLFYYDGDDLLDISSLDISSIDSTTDSFEGYAMKDDGDLEEFPIISWDNETGTLDISGVIFTNGDFSIGDKGNPIEYVGKGTIVSTGDISIHGNLLAKHKDGSESFPEIYTLGLVAYEDINIATGPGDSQLKMMGAFYAQNQIVSAKQNQMAGTFVSNEFDMGTNVPSIFQVPGLEDNLPPGMPGAAFIYRIFTSDWHEVHE